MITNLQDHDQIIPSFIMVCVAARKHSNHAVITVFENNR